MSWVPAPVRPTKAGVYAVRVPGLALKTWARFTGEFWCCWSISAELAAKCEWPGVRNYDWLQP